MCVCVSLSIYMYVYIYIYIRVHNPALGPFAPAGLMCRCALQGVLDISTCGDAMASDCAGLPPLTLGTSGSWQCSRHVGTNLGSMD